MTLEEIKKLNDTQLNIMVAELSGLWKRKRVNSHGYQIWTRLKDGQDRGESMLPDFCNNLNAIHDAVNTFTKFKYQNFVLTFC